MAVSYGVGVAPKDKNGKRIQGKFCTFRCRSWVLTTALHLIKPPSIWLRYNHPNVGNNIISYYVSAKMVPKLDADLAERDLGRSSKLTNDAIIYMRMAKYTLRCSATFCLNSIQSTGREFQRCGKCGIALYCGKECQTSSWRDKDFPHKKICPILSELVEQSGGEDVIFKCPRPEDPRHFPPNFRRS